jgi:leucine-rich repeat transmembrane neuronal protein 1/2
MRSLSNPGSPLGATPLTTVLLTLLYLASTLSFTEAIYFQGTGTSYARFPKWHACKDSRLRFDFKTTQTNGLLLYADDGGKYDFFEMRLLEGRVNLRLNIVDGRDGAVKLEMGTDLADNKWHTVEVRRNRMETTLVVDGNADSKTSFGSDFVFGILQKNSPLYFGGIPHSKYNGAGLHLLALPSVFFEKRFRGYIRNIINTNCTCQPIRAGHLQGGEGITDIPQETCDRDNPCRKGCICISKDSGADCDCARINCHTGKSELLLTFLGFGEQIVFEKIQKNSSPWEVIPWAHEIGSTQLPVQFCCPWGLLTVDPSCWFNNPVNNK